MTSRRLAFVMAVLTTAVVCFTLGVMHARRLDASDRVDNDARLDARLAALKLELQDAIARDGRAGSAPVGTGGGSTTVAGGPSDAPDRAGLVAEIKGQLRSEMGLLPVSLLRERRASFVELYAYDSRGDRSYGTAGYLGHGYFVTVKHAVVALGESDDRTTERTIGKVAVLYKGREVPVRVVDAGKATKEVDPGDWAILKTRDLDLPALSVDTAFPFEFADTIVRFGNDYSKGIVVSSGYVGQKTDSGLVTSLADGHPGVSGGGVLDQRGVLVGIPIGRMQGDYRFSFILPVRPEMLRAVPGVQRAAPSDE